MSAERPGRTEIRHSTAPDGAHTVTVTGEVDIFNAPQFEDVLDRVAEGGAILVDLRECRYVDSAAIAALIRLRKKAKGSIRIVVNGKGAVRRVLTVTKLDQIIDIESVGDSKTA